MSDVVRTACRRLLTGLAVLLAGVGGVHAGGPCTTIAAEQVANLQSAGGGAWTYEFGAVGDRGLGGPESDLILIEFYSPQVGAFALGTGDNGNYATCEQCVRLVVDAGASSKQQLFGAEGVLSINQGPGGAQLDVMLQNVRLVEVTFDPDTFESIPVPGGACLLLDQQLIFADGFEP